MGEELLVPVSSWHKVTDYAKCLPQQYRCPSQSRLYHFMHFGVQHISNFRQLLWTSGPNDFKQQKTRPRERMSEAELLTEHEVNIGNKSRVNDRGEAEVFYEVSISYIVY